MKTRRGCGGARIVETETDRGWRYRAECSCGWVSNYATSDRTRQEQRLRQHLHIGPRGEDLVAYIRHRFAALPAASWLHFTREEMAHALGLGLSPTRRHFDRLRASGVAESGGGTPRPMLRLTTDL